MATAAPGPGLEQILWRALDRVPRRPALIDSAEFADRIAGAFVGDTPSERWVDRFFAGNPELRARATLDFAQAIVHASSKRMHVYEFDLGRIEYVLIEEKKELVVVSELGQFAAPSDDRLARAIESAAVSEARVPRAAVAASEPRAFLVKQDGSVVALDAPSVARALARVDLRPMSLPAVARPPARLAPFQPRRLVLTPEREVTAMRENEPRTKRLLPHRSESVPTLQSGIFDAGPRGDAPILDAGSPLPGGAVAVADGAPAGGASLPDGSLAKPQIGAGSRWQRMLGNGALQASFLAPAARGLDPRSDAAGGQVVALSTAQPALGAVGARAEASSAAMIAARGDLAPVRVLGDDALARAVAAGATFEPALAAHGFATGVDRFWVQPELALGSAGGEAASARNAPSGELVARGRPLRLGEITGDPWSDWALVGSGQAALAQRSDPVPGGAQLLAARGTQMRATGDVPLASSAGADPVVAWRRADGVVLVQGAQEPGSAELPRTARPPLASRSGAIPAPALAALQLGIEQTARAGAYKLPPLRLSSAPDALEAGAELPLSGSDPRRGGVRLAGPAVVTGAVARLALSMPFPTGSTLHVGTDLDDALSTLVSLPLVASGSATSPAPATQRSGVAEPFAGPTSFAAGSLSVAGPVAGRPSVARGSAALPDLLRRAVLAEGWTPATVARFSGPARARGPSAVDLPAASGEVEGAPAGFRPLGVGEDEIVIPLPLWAQMGQERLSPALPVLSSPVAALGYEPPLGTYRLVVPSGLPWFAPMDGEAAVGMARIVGPSNLDLVATAGGFETRRPDGEQPLARVPVGETAVPRRGRLGAPLDPEAATALRMRAAAPSQELVLPPAPPSSVTATSSPATSTSAPGSTAAPPEAQIDSEASGNAVQAPLAGAATRRVVPADADSPAEAVRWTYVEAPRASRIASVPAAIGVRSVAVNPGPTAWTARAALPAGLRFRYAASPLWWSRLLRRAPGSDVRVPRALLAGNSGAMLWRSILVSGARAEPGAALDHGWESRAGQLAGSEARLDAMAAATLARGATAGSRAPRTAGPETVYVAFDDEGRAGTVLESRMTSAARQKIEALQMSIVAAIPPAPPPIETMAAPAAPPGAPQVHTRRRPEQAFRDEEAAVSHSRIEGSVDAIAQRIYHRIRRRIESDRERFGG